MPTDEQVGEIIATREVVEHSMWWSYMVAANDRN